MNEGLPKRTLGSLIHELETIDPRKAPDTTFNYIDVSSVSRDDFKVDSSSPILGKDAPSRARRLVRTGDVIFATIRPTLKRIAYIGDAHNEAVCSTGYFVLRARSEINPKYLYYYLQSNEFIDAMGKLERGTSYPAVSDADVRAHTLALLPPLDEQKRILSILDQAFEGLDRARANAEANLESAKELLESARQVALTPPENSEAWHSVKLGDVATLQRGFDLPKRLRSSGPFPLVTSSGPSDTHSEAKVKGPGVVTGRSGSIGSVFYIEEDFWPLNTSLYVKDFHGNEPRFVLHLLRHFDLSRFASGTGVPTLNRNDVHEVVISLPTSRDVQKTIASKIEAIAETAFGAECEYKAKRDDLEDLRNSLLKKAFAGELI